MSRNVERGQATRRSLVETATSLFTEQGYEATSIETVLQQSGVSRGALYHHFDSKEALFEAVLEAIEIELTHAALAATKGIQDPASLLRIGGDVFLEAAQTRKVRQIVLLDAPAALGWQKWRAIEARHGLGLLKATLEAAARSGRLKRELVDVYAHMLLATLIELALMVARADDPKKSGRAARAALAQMIDSLLGAPRT